MNILNILISSYSFWDRYHIFNSIVLDIFLFMIILLHSQTFLENNKDSKWQCFFFRDNITKYYSISHISFLTMYYFCYLSKGKKYISWTIKSHIRNCCSNSWWLINGLLFPLFLQRRNFYYKSDSGATTHKWIFVVMADVDRWVGNITYRLLTCTMKVSLYHRSISKPFSEHRREWGRFQAVWTTYSLYSL